MRLTYTDEDRMLQIFIRYRSTLHLQWSVYLQIRERFTFLNSKVEQRNPTRQLEV